MAIRDEIERILQADPHRNLKALADELGITKARVYQVLEELGYSKAWVKARKRRTVKA